MLETSKRQTLPPQLVLLEEKFESVIQNWFILKLKKYIFRGFIIFNTFSVIFRKFQFENFQRDISVILRDVCGKAYHSD